MDLEQDGKKCGTRFVFDCLAYLLLADINKLLFPHLNTDLFFFFSLFLKLNNQGKEYNNLFRKYYTKKNELMVIQGVNKIW